jgi:hypothetical protein
MDNILKTSEDAEYNALGQQWLDLDGTEFIAKYGQFKYDHFRFSFYTEANSEFNHIDQYHTGKTYMSQVQEVAKEVTRNSLIAKLKESLCEVSFTKINGDERIMTCTLDEDIIPVEHHPKGGERHSISLKNIAVWDINAEGWRSFRPENVFKFSIISDEISTPF